MIGPAQIGLPLADIISLPAITPPLGDEGGAFAQLLPVIGLPLVNSAEAPIAASPVAVRSTMRQPLGGDTVAIAVALPDDVALPLQRPLPTDHDCACVQEDDVPGIVQMMPEPIIAAYPSITFPWPNSDVVAEAANARAGTASTRLSPTLSAALASAPDLGSPQPSSPLFVSRSAAPEPVALVDALPPQIIDMLLASGAKPTTDHPSLPCDPTGQIEFASPVQLEKTLAAAMLTRDALGDAPKAAQVLDTSRPSKELSTYPDFDVEIGAGIQTRDDAHPAIPARGFDAGKLSLAVGESHAPVSLAAQVDHRATETLRAAAYLDDLASDILATRTFQSGASFRLATEMLGQVGIAIDPSPEGLSVQITAHGDDASVVVAAAQPRLHDELRAQGVRVSDHAGQPLGHQSSGERDRGPPRSTVQSSDIAPESEHPFQSGERARATSHRFA